MSARILNTPKSKSQGYTDQFPALDIRVLRKRGIIVSGQKMVALISGASLPGGLVASADARKAGEETPRIEWPARSGPANKQQIPMSSRAAPLGGQRWYFVDDNGRRVERLYFVGGRFVSRQAARLTSAVSPRAPLIYC